MKNKKIIWGLIAFSAFAGLIIFARPDTGVDNASNTAGLATGAGSGVLRADALSFDFGNISMEKGRVRHVFTARNSGAAPVTVARMYTSCMCTTALLVAGDKTFGPFGMPGHASIPYISASIEPGKEFTVEAVFDPNAHGPTGFGPIDRNIVLENDAGEPLILNIKGNVVR